MKSIFFAILLAVTHGLTTTGQEAGQQASVYQTPQIEPQQNLWLSPYPQTILRPQVQWVPYQLQRVEATPWRTPIRSWLFGPMRQVPIYQAVPPQSTLKIETPAVSSPLTPLNTTSLQGGTDV